MNTPFYIAILNEVKYLFDSILKLAKDTQENVKALKLYLTASHNI